MYCLGWSFVVTSEKGEVIATNVTKCPVTSSQQLLQQVGFSHTVKYHTSSSIANHKLKPGDSMKKAEFRQLLHCYTCFDV